MPTDESIRPGTGDIDADDHLATHAPAPTFETARLRLEPLRLAHAEVMQPVLADPRLYSFIGGAPPTLGALRAQYARQARGRSPDGSERWFNWIVHRRADGAAAGFVQGTVYAPSLRHATAAIAWLIAPEFQGRRYGVEAMMTVRDWLAHHGVRELVAHIHPANAASHGIALALGLQPGEHAGDGEVRWHARLDTPPGSDNPSVVVSRAHPDEWALVRPCGSPR